MGGTRAALIAGGDTASVEAPIPSRILFSMPRKVKLPFPEKNPADAMTPRRPSPVDVLLLAVIAGVLATVLGGYAYATSDQVEQLPMILRAMDSDYLSEDLAVSAGSPVRAG